MCGGVGGGSCRSLASHESDRGRCKRARADAWDLPRPRRGGGRAAESLTSRIGRSRDGGRGAKIGSYGVVSGFAWVLTVWKAAKLEGLLVMSPVHSLQGFSGGLRRGT